ncbi:unnamed protein product [Trifolium pratense]|uniref:Uncharacterized protein n=1 Tax=Trifolium pratense TaxID=57577 RepID=A0ACB0J2E6_TRIPR|nr:unnamed protein product [Trifolium pratense]
MFSCKVARYKSVVQVVGTVQGHNISGKDQRVHCSININTETGKSVWPVVVSPFCTSVCGIFWWIIY